MDSNPIVIEQRLKSTAVSALLGIFFIVVAVAGIVLASLSNTYPRLPVVIVVDVAVTIILVVGFFSSLRIVVRVVETLRGRPLEAIYGKCGVVRQYFQHAENVVART